MRERLTDAAAQATRELADGWEQLVQGSRLCERGQLISFRRYKSNGDEVAAAKCLELPLDDSREPFTLRQLAGDAAYQGRAGGTSHTFERGADGTVRYHGDYVRLPQVRSHQIGDGASQRRIRTSDDEFGYEERIRRAEFACREQGRRGSNA